MQILGEIRVPTVVMEREQNGKFMKFSNDFHMLGMQHMNGEDRHGESRKMFSRSLWEP